MINCLKKSLFHHNLVLVCINLRTCITLLYNHNRMNAERHIFFYLQQCRVRLIFLWNTSPYLFSLVYYFANMNTMQMQWYAKVNSHLGFHESQWTGWVTLKSKWLAKLFEAINQTFSYIHKRVKRTKYVNLRRRKNVNLSRKSLLQ